MRRSETAKSPRRLTGVRKSMVNTERSGPSNVRNSLMGRNSYCPSTSKTGKRRQLNKDPRGLNKDKAKQREVCAIIIEFMFEYCGTEITMKQILNCSTSLYRDTFLAIGRLIFAQNFTLEQKNNVAESICYVMETLDYPYTLNKSTFVNLTMTSFPTAIGVLDWLIQFYKCVDREPDELDEDSPLHVCIAHYGQYIQQNDEQEVLEQVEKTFAEKLDSFNDEEQLEKEEAEIDGELEDLIARKNLMTELEDNLASKIGKEKDTQKYVQHNKQSVEYIKKVHEKLSKSITQLNDERAQIKLNNQKLLAQIGDKENAEDLQKAYKKKELVLKSHQADRSSYQNQCNQCDVPITRLKSKIADQVHDYNQLVLDSRLDKSEEYLLEDNLVHDVLKGQSIIDIKSQIISEKCQERQKGIGSLLLEANELKHEIQKIENNSQELESEKEEMMAIAQVKYEKTDRLIEDDKRKQNSLKTQLSQLKLEKSDLDQEIEKNKAGEESVKLDLQTNSIKHFKQSINAKDIKIFDKIKEVCKKVEDGVSHVLSQVQNEVSEERRELLLLIAQAEEEGLQLDNEIRKYL